MDSFTGETVLIESRTTQRSGSESVASQTDPVKMVETCTDTQSKYDRAIQVDVITQSLPQLPITKIDKSTVDEIILLLNQNYKEYHILKKLNGLHNPNRIAIFYLKQINLIKSEELPIIDIECNQRGVIAVSYGQNHHVTWCSHNAKVVLWRGKRTSQVLLNCCPTATRFGSGNSLFVAGQNGTLYCIIEGETKFQIEAHQLCITGLEWLSRGLLVTSSLDGQICIYSWKGISLKKIRSLLITVSDLPRKLRKHNYVDKNIGIASVTCKDKELFIGGETGVVWKISYPEFLLTVVMVDPDGIDAIHLLGTNIILLTPFLQVKLYTVKGVLLDTIDEPFNCFRCLEPNLLLFTNSTLLSIYSIHKRELVQQKQFTCTLFTVNSENQLLSVSADQKYIDVYRIVLEN